jgi:hypothetical protein
MFDERIGVCHERDTISKIIRFFINYIYIVYIFDIINLL